MRKLKCEVTIGDFKFDFVTDIEIVSSWDQLTDTCTITIPKKLRYRGSDGQTKINIVRGSEAIFKQGDAVKVEAGYYPTPEYGEVSTYNTIFEGKIVSISPTRPIVIQCEDSAYDLKRMRIGQFDTAGKTRDLKEVLVVLGNLVDSNSGGFNFRYGVQAESMPIGPVSIENMTYAAYLEHLKRTYGLKSYIRNNVLYVGFARITQNNTGDVFGLPNKSIPVKFGRDIVASDGLSYNNASDVAINLTCISIDDLNDRIQATAGDPWGSARNLYYYNKTQKTLDKIAEEMVSEFKFDGYRGSFTMFGIPDVNHGDSIVLEDSDVPDNNGEYLLEKVIKRFGINGFRQEIFLGQKIR